MLLIRETVKKKANNDLKRIDQQARKLHEDWLRLNQNYVEQCRTAPGIYSCSRDFDRVVAWQKLPEFWKNYYRREARYLLLINTAI